MPRRARVGADPQERSQRYPGKAHPHGTVEHPLQPAPGRLVKGLWESTAYRRMFASMIIQPVLLIQVLKGLGHVGHVDGQAEIMGPLPERLALRPRPHSGTG